MRSPLVFSAISIAAAALGFANPAFAQAMPPAQATAAGKPATVPAKPAAKPAAKSGATPPRLARSAQKAVEEQTPIDDDPSIQLTDADLEMAKQVHVGEMPCELGGMVKLAPARRAGFFIVTTKGYRFLMHPVESRTGAIRIEDGKRGAMWLQLGNKSMLMSQKLGQRLSDECQSPQQVTFAEELKRNPRPSILDAPVPAAPAATPPSAPAAEASPAAAATQPDAAGTAPASPASAMPAAAPSLPPAAPAN